MEALISSDALLELIAKRKAAAREAIAAGYESQLYGPPCEVTIPGLGFWLEEESE